ncbi:MAG TPA: hypothetical protein VFB14_16410 [Bryobacteraceae bacterium]|jgi:hypothetical protein|nr:hypothetical protein [Bryobacteraceae bacterium]
MLEHAEYREIHAGWMAEFEPEGYQENRLVEILIQNDWTLKLAQRNLMQAEEALWEGWTPERQQDFDVRLRSKATAERSFYRAWSALRSLLKELERRNVQTVRLQGKLEKLRIEIAEQRKALGLPEEDEPVSTEPASLHSLHTFCPPNMPSDACSKHEAGDVKPVPAHLAGFRKNCL